ncbi:hypothetical protein BGZ92_007638 [Podila epicladia]|nr:hypothetical protein BGZ92_007638 [Podila epicladia]
MSGAPLEYLLIKIICKDYYRNGDFYWDDLKDECNTPPVLAQAALVTSRIASVKSITAVFTIGFYTSLSDRVGRKLLMYLTLIPAVFSQLFVVYMALPSTQLGLGFLYIDAFLNGTFGAGTLLVPALNAYIADSTPRDQRPVVIGYTMVAFSLGLIIGPALGLFYIKWTGENSSALILSASAFALLAVYCVFVPESLPTVAQRRVESEVDAKEVPTFLMRLKLTVMKTLDPLLLFLPGRIDEFATASKPPRRYTLLMIVCANAMLNFALNGLTTVFIPFAMLYKRFVLLDHSKRSETQGQDETSPLMEEQGLYTRPKVNISDSNVKDDLRRLRLC